MNQTVVFELIEDCTQDDLPRMFAQHILFRSYPAYYPVRDTDYEIITTLPIDPSDREIDQNGNVLIDHWDEFRVKNHAYDVIIMKDSTSGNRFLCKYTLIF